MVTDTAQKKTIYPDKPGWKLLVPEYHMRERFGAYTEICESRNFKENHDEVRGEIHARAKNNFTLQRALLDKCREDPLFWMNTFCCLFEPRPQKDDEGNTKSKIIPYNSWPSQDYLTYKGMDPDHFGFRDLGCFKSRGEGVTWTCILMLMHDWLFSGEPVCHGLVSRNQLAADNMDDPDSLTWKIMWELSMLPNWMISEDQYKYASKKHSIVLKETRGVMIAYAATGDVASGGRKGVFLMDEFAKFARGEDTNALNSTQPVSNCRWFISSPKGEEGAFFEVMNEDSDMVKLEIGWETNPTRNRGLYKFDKKNQIPVAESPEDNPLPHDYQTIAPPLYERIKKKGFQIEHRIRSPWYDSECDRAGATPEGIAQEYDRNFGGTEHKVFSAQFRARIESSSRVPFKKYEVTVDPTSHEMTLMESESGPLWMWSNLDSAQRPQKRDYVVGCDIGTGKGGPYTSNSVATIVDHVEDRQVAELASNQIEAEDFADLVICLCEMYWMAHLAWEANGPGGAPFTKRVIDRRYANVFKRKNMWQTVAKRQSQPGWWSDDKTRPALIADLNHAVKYGEFIIMSKPVIAESNAFIMRDGKIENKHSRTTKHDGSKGTAHADRIIALGVAWHACKQRQVSGPPKEDEAQYLVDAPPNSMAHRELEYMLSQQKINDDWQEPFIPGGSIGSIQSDW